VAPHQLDAAFLDLRAPELEEDQVSAGGKVNGMLSPIQRRASEMGRGPVIFKNGRVLFLTPDFFRAYSAFQESNKS
jgi:hypothetical protein